MVSQPTLLIAPSAVPRFYGFLVMAVPIPLAEVQQDHPYLWGAVETRPPAPLVTARHARLLPTRPSGAGGEGLWWRARTQGALDHQHQPIAACTDLRVLPLAIGSAPAGRQLSHRRGEPVALAADGVDHLLSRLQLQQQPSQAR